MKISKHLHSCLLVEESGKTFLIDPGNYTFDEKALVLNSIANIDYLLITHEHQDHMYLPFIKEILAKFPNVKVISNSSVAEMLLKEDIKGVTTGDELVKMQILPHEKIWFGSPIPNSIFTIADRLTHPGDCHHFDKTTEILALPLQAPWGSTTAAVELAEKLKPKVIIPIHDWHWNDQAREAMYKRLADYFASLGIQFIGLKTGEVVEV